MSDFMKCPWKREGTTVYALNEQGTNIFSFGVQAGYKYQTKHNSERITIDELVAIAELARSAPELKKWAEVGPELLDALESARLLITHIEMDAYGTTYDRQWLVDALAKARAIGK